MWFLVSIAGIVASRPQAVKDASQLSGLSEKEVVMRCMPTTDVMDKATKDLEEKLGRKLTSAEKRALGRALGRENMKVKIIDYLKKTQDDPKESIAAMTEMSAKLKENDDKKATEDGLGEEDLNHLNETAENVVR